MTSPQEFINIERQQSVPLPQEYQTRVHSPYSLRVANLSPPILISNKLDPDSLLPSEQNNPSLREDDEIVEVISSQVDPEPIVEPVMYRNNSYLKKNPNKSNLNCLVFTIIFFGLIILIPTSVKLGELNNYQTALHNNVIETDETIVMQHSLSCSEIFELGFFHNERQFSTRNVTYQCPRNNCRCDLLSSLWISKRNKVAVYFHYDNPSDFEFSNKYPKKTSTIVFLMFFVMLISAIIFWLICWLIYRLIKKL